MKLSDIVSAAGLTSWAEVGLVVSFITFIAIVVYVFVIRSKESYEDERNLPLMEERDGCQVRRFRRLAEEPSSTTVAVNGQSSESSDLAPPEASS